MPRACEEICPTGAIRSGSMADLANQGRERAAARLSGADMQGFPAMVVNAHKQFGND